MAPSVFFSSETKSRWPFVIESSGLSVWRQGEWRTWCLCSPLACFQCFAIHDISASPSQESALSELTSHLGKVVSLVQMPEMVSL